MYTLCDVGGTKIRTAFSLGGDTFFDSRTFSTPSSYALAIEEIIQDIRKHDSRALVMGLPGALNKDRNTLVSAPNIPEWVGKNIIQDIQRKTQVRVFLENDSALSGLGESVYGAGKYGNIIMYMTISTGVGGVRIVNKKIDAYTFGFEPGHQIVDVDETVLTHTEALSHKEPSHFDTFVSGRSMEEMLGKVPNDIHDTEIWKMYAKRVAVGIYNAILFWSPDTVVLGGSMMTGNPHIPLKIVTDELQLLMKTFEELPIITISQLKDESGLYGALHYIKHIKV